MENCVNQVTASEMWWKIVPTNCFHHNVFNTHIMLLKELCSL